MPKYALFLMLVIYTSCTGQGKIELSKENTRSESKDVSTYQGPNSITRNIIQDRKGNIWMAAFDGVFKYDGKAFTNVSGKISSARFFSLLEDRKGNFWFGSIGSGVYYYDGQSFRNFTTKDGLLNNEVTSIYEDKKGNIWFGVSGGVSRYDGKSFRNYIIDGNEMHEDRTGKTFANRQAYEVTSIMETKTGRFWLATRGNTFVYDGKTFTVFNHEGKPFRNVRSIIEDKKGDIWLGGADGLWRYDGKTSTNITRDFVGHIYEDKKGNVWTSSSKSAADKTWMLSRYDEKSLSDKMPTTSVVKSREGMIFGMLQVKNGSIWFGSFGGVYRFDGKNIKDFKNSYTFDQL